MKKKVIQLIHGLTMGGAETLVKEYCLNLDREKYDVSVLCFYKYGTPYETLLEEAGIKLIYIDDYNQHKKNGKLKNFISIVKRCMFVKQYIRKERPDVLHTHLAVNSYVLFAKPKKKVKIVHMVHSEPKKLWNKRISRRIDFFAAKRLAEHYHMQFITLHDKMKIEIDEMFQVKDTVILKNGIDFKRFDAALPKIVVRERENILQNAYVIGHVGRFTAVKNHKFLVNVFKKICEKNENAFLLLIGNGSLKKEIQNLLKEKELENKSLILSDRTDVPDLLNSMDVFVLPSSHEGMPIVLIEAQKTKLPCVISDTITEEVVISNLIVKMSLEESIEHWAEEILNHKVREIEYYGLKEWDMSNVVEKLQKIYES